MIFDREILQHFINMENNTKILERSRTNRVIAGVCAGLANYFNIDISLMRVLFIVAFICGSFGFWLYIILWIVVPEERLLDQARTEKSTDETIDITPKEEKKTNNGPLIAGLILIFVGLVALANNFLYVGWIWKLWPMILIIIGAVILVNSLKNEKHEQ